MVFTYNYNYRMSQIPTRWRYAHQGPYPSEFRPSAVLSIREFAFFQRRDADRALFDLAAKGWDAYRFALSLLSATTPIPDRPLPDCSVFTLPWDRLCAWYRTHRFDNQLDLFLCSQETEIHRWRGFTEQHCFQPILQSPHLVRSLLEATGMIAVSTKRSRRSAEDIISLLLDITTEFKPASRPVT